MRDGIGEAVAVDVAVAVEVRVGSGEGLFVSVIVGVAEGVGLLAHAYPPAKPAASKNNPKGKKINPRLTHAILDENA